MTRWVTSLKELMKSPKGLPFSPATRTPQPKISAMKMICSIAAVDSGLIALDGKMLTMVSIRLALLASYSAPSASCSIGKLPLNALAMTRPITQAMAVVTRK